MNIIHKLAATSSRSSKVSLLKLMTEDEWRVFVFAYHPDSKYGIKYSDDEIDMDNLGEPTPAMFQLLERIVDKEILSSEAKRQVTACSEMYGDLIKLIINKDLRCGVSASTLNAAHPMTIPQFKVMLAKEVPLAKVQFPVLAQLKYDGVRLLAIVDDCGVVFKTRNGNEVRLPGLAKTIGTINAVNFVLDGEITYGDGYQDDRTGISGAINSAMHGGTVDESNMVFHVFDFMAKSQFDYCKCNEKYDTRFGYVQQLVNGINSQFVRVAVTNEVHNAEGVQQLYDGALAMGYEGLILKREDHQYEFKRSKHWVKMKEIKSADLTCTGVKEGTGKYRGQVGALICKGKVEGFEIKVDVGSGLSDLQRSVPVREYYGQTIEVKYNAVIRDSVTKEWSLFLPRFARVRVDK